MITDINTTGWVRIPFSVMGYNFNSVLDPNGSMYKQVLNIPQSLFLDFNKSAITELWTERKHLSITELLAVINDGGTQAFVELAGE